MTPPAPGSLSPMMATATALPGVEEQDSYGYEMKWDGVRALVYVDTTAADIGGVSVRGRSGRDYSVAFPELAAIREVLGASSVVLDGEIVALAGTGVPDFGLLQQRVHVSDPGTARRLSAVVPVTFLAFDLLDLDGHSTLTFSYRQRRELLEGLELAASFVAVPPTLALDPGTALEVSRQQGLEGIVAKRWESSYRSGSRSKAWRKVKNYASAEVVIVGWKTGDGGRSASLGSLLLGMPDLAGTLRFVGHVGSGFSADSLVLLRTRLDELEVRRPTITDVPSQHLRQAHWVRPELVAEVRFGNWTSEGRLRHPTWRGLRPDKTPADLCQDTPPPGHRNRRSQGECRRSVTAPAGENEVLSQTLRRTAVTRPRMLASSPEIGW